MIIVYNLIHDAVYISIKNSKILHDYHNKGTGNNTKMNTITIMTLNEIGLIKNNIITSVIDITINIIIVDMYQHF